MTLNFIKDSLERQKIRAALKIASSAIAVDAVVNTEATDAENFDLDHDLWH